MEKLKVALGINYWDDPKGLIRILNESTYDFVDRIYLIDGRYKTREDVPQYGDEMDYIIAPKRKVQLTRLYDAKQITKRNRYWERAEEDNMDFLIVIDSDEYMTIDSSLFLKSLEQLSDRPERCYPISEITTGVATFSRPRLFKPPFDYRHRPNRGGNGISHGSLYTEYGESDYEIINEFYAYFKWNPDVDIHMGQGIPGIQMYQDKTYRSRERVIADRVYYDTVPDR